MSHPLIELASTRGVRQASGFRAAATEINGPKLAAHYEAEKANAPRLLAEAVRFALHAHGEQTRKGSQIPYVSHLLQVAGLVLEHGGDPDSIAFCESVGLDYVSCSPFRVPIARLAAAQATLAKE